MILSGSYDHTVKLWDPRSNSCAIDMDHGCPVESVLFMPGNGLACSAGGNKIKFWDLLNGGRLIQTISPHSKNITCLTLDGNSTHLLSGSLDHQVKVIGLTDYKVMHSFKYPAPILSLGVSVNCH